MQTIELDVQGMSCSNCVKHVTQALQAVSGVDAVAVDLASGHVKVTTSAVVASEALIAALKDADYGAQESLNT